MRDSTREGSQSLAEALFFIEVNVMRHCVRCDNTRWCVKTIASLVEVQQKDAALAGALIMQGRQSELASCETVQICASHHGGQCGRYAGGPSRDPGLSAAGAANLPPPQRTWGHLEGRRLGSTLVGSVRSQSSVPLDVPIRNQI